MTGLLISLFFLLSSMYYFLFVDILTLTDVSLWVSLLLLLIELLIWKMPMWVTYNSLHLPLLVFVRMCACVQRGCVWVSLFFCLFPSNQLSLFWGAYSQSSLILHLKTVTPTSHWESAMSHTHCGIQTCWHHSAAVILAQSRQARCCLLLCCDCCIRNQSQALPTDNRMAINCRLWPNLSVVFSCLHRDQWQPSAKQLFVVCLCVAELWHIRTQLSFSDRKY